MMSSPVFDKGWQQRIETGLAGACPPLPNIGARRRASRIEQAASYAAAVVLLAAAAGTYLLAVTLGRGNHWWVMLAPVGFGTQQAGLHLLAATWRRGRR